MEGQHENEGQKNGKNENCPERGFSLFSVFSGHGKYKKKRHKKKKKDPSKCLWNALMALSPGKMPQKFTGIWAFCQMTPKKTCNLTPLVAML
jgi:hypothetical protein